MNVRTSNNDFMDWDPGAIQEPVSFDDLVSDNVLIILSNLDNKADSAEVCQSWYTSISHIRKTKTIDAIKNIIIKAEKLQTVNSNHVVNELKQLQTKLVLPPELDNLEITSRSVSRNIIKILQNLSLEELNQINPGLPEDINPEDAYQIPMDLRLLQAAYYEKQIIHQNFNPIDRLYNKSTIWPFGYTVNDEDSFSEDEEYDLMTTELPGPVFEKTPFWPFAYLTNDEDALFSLGENLGYEKKVYFNWTLLNLLVNSPSL